MNSPFSPLASKSALVLALWTNAALIGAAHADLPSNLSVSGGIALPSAQTAVHTNPAGLVDQRGVKISAQAGANEVWDQPQTYRAQLGAGVGIVGVAAGLDYVNRAGENDKAAFYGLGVNVSPLKLTLGVSGTKELNGAKNSDYNAGLFFDPSGKLRLAMTARGLDGDVDEYGLGLAFELISGVALTIDAAVDGDWKDNDLKPGLYIGNRFAGATISYGTGNRLQFVDDVSAGLYLKLAVFDFEFLYRAGGRFPDYYAALSFGF